MLFIPASSSHFGGLHWAIYNEAKSFYSYDDGDATDGERSGSHNMMPGSGMSLHVPHVSTLAQACHYLHDVIFEAWNGPGDGKRGYEAICTAVR